MDVFRTLSETVIVPVVVLDDEKNAVPTAQATARKMPQTHPSFACRNIIVWSKNTRFPRRNMIPHTNLLSTIQRDWQSCC